MPRFDNVRTIPFTADEMFALVADVEKYPLFVPLCESLVVHSREQRDDGTGLITATMGRTENTSTRPSGAAKARAAQ